MVDVICRLLGAIGVALMVFMFPVAALLPVMYGIYFFVVRRKDGWRKYPFAWLDLLTPVIASIVWVVMVSTITTHKSLSNLLVEPFEAGAAYCLLWAMRLWRFSRISNDKRKVALKMLWIICAVIATVALLTPCLPE